METEESAADNAGVAGSFVSGSPASCVRRAISVSAGSSISNDGGAMIIGAGSSVSSS